MFITKSNRLLRKILIIVSFLTVYAVIFSISDSSAYWIDSVTTPEEEVISMEIQIGEWDFDDGGKGPSEPEPQPYDGYILDEWIDSGELDRVIEDGQMFSYGENLYISTSNYNPAYHGLPGEPNTEWAFVALQLEREPGHNYRLNAVVIRNGKWYITKTSGTWFVDDPLNSKDPWDTWREIMPLSEDVFGIFPNSTIKDYTLSNRDGVVIYK